MNDIVEFSDFVKLDLRVGTVVAVEPVEKSEKLLRFEIDFGVEIGKRQILAGLKPFYTIEDLIDRQVVAIVNLAPRKMMGIESQGMLMAAGDETASLLMPDRAQVNGTIVR